MDDKSKEFLEATGGDARAAAPQPVQTAEDERAAFEDALIDAVVAYGEACGHGDASECGTKMERVEDAIGGLVATLSSAPTQPVREPMWQPIETAPKDGSLFLCWVMAVRYGETDEGQQYQEDVSQADFCHWQSHDDAPDGGWFEPCCGQIGDGQAVTHWMPLPAAPGITKE